MKTFKSTYTFVSLFISFLILSISANSAAAASPIKADSEILFSGTQMGRTFNGQVEQFEAEAQFNADKSLIHLVLTLPSTALITANKKRNQVMQSEEWLNSAQYPEIRFEGRSQSNTSNVLQVQGSLLIKGIAHPITLTVQQQNEGGRTLLTTEGKIDRLAYQLGTGEWLDTKVVGKEIVFNARLVFSL